MLIYLKQRVHVDRSRSQAIVYSSQVSPVCAMYITVLRVPVEQALSHVRYALPKKQSVELFVAPDVPS
jgi:hypothetical protein